MAMGALFAPATIEAQGDERAIPTDSQATHAGTETPAAPEVPTSADASTTPAGSPSPYSPASRYGLRSATPAAVAILLAILFRQVIPALIVGLVVGAYMLVPCLPNEHALASAPSWLAGLRLAVEHLFFDALREKDKAFPGHLAIVVFTLVIGFTVGVMGRSGGTAGMVHLVAGSSTSRRRASLTAWLAGMVVFFDDYANTMIIGPTMRPVFDRVRLSRAKLAYIVDTTAAPVASLALIGTWVGAEVGYIQDGLNAATAAAVAMPAFLTQGGEGGVASAMQVFIASLPYRFYAVLALVMVFLVALMGRDFGPMLAAERRAAEGEAEDAPGESASHAGQAPPAPNWVLGLMPVLVLVVVTVGVLLVTGYYAAGAAALEGSRPLWLRLHAIVQHADSYLSILYGALASAVAAVSLTLLARACRLRVSMDAGLEGMSRMFPAIVILVLAWSLSSVLTELQLGGVVAEHLKAGKFPVQWMSLAVFVSAAMISFATGTSWGTMGILCPVVVEVSLRLIEVAPGMPPAFAAMQFYGAVGAVLAGAVFGDHCSPISDTTVLSSIASSCRHEEHVWTQLPYALLTAVASMGLGDVLCSAFGIPWYWGWASATVFLMLVLLVFGRSVRVVEPVSGAIRSGSREPSPLRRRLLERMQSPTEPSQES